MRLGRLLRFPAHLLAIALPGERLLCSTLVTRLQVEGVLLDVLDDVFLLHLALETPQRAFDRLTFLQFHLGHLVVTPFLVRFLASRPPDRQIMLTLAPISVGPSMLGYHIPQTPNGANNPFTINNLE